MQKQLPRVVVSGRFDGKSTEEVFASIADISRYPELMDFVVEVEIESETATERVASWEVKLRGSLLRWTESAQIDWSATRIGFSQVSGDLDVFGGGWAVESSDGGSTATIQVSFSIGIPMLATMLEPVAVEALTVNLVEMLDSLGATTTTVIDGFGIKARTIPSEGHT